MLRTANTKICHGTLLPVCHIKLCQLWYIWFEKALNKNARDNQKVRNMTDMAGVCFKVKGGGGGDVGGGHSFI